MAPTSAKGATKNTTATISKATESGKDTSMAPTTEAKQMSEDERLAIAAEDTRRRLAEAKETIAATKARLSDLAAEGEQDDQRLTVLHERRDAALADARACEATHAAFTQQGSPLAATIAAELAAARTRADELTAKIDAEQTRQREARTAREGEYRALTDRLHDAEATARELAANLAALVRRQREQREQREQAEADALVAAMLDARQRQREAREDEVAAFGRLQQLGTEAAARAAGRLDTANAAGGATTNRTPREVVALRAAGFLDAVRELRESSGALAYPDAATLSHTLGVLDENTLLRLFYGGNNALGSGWQSELDAMRERLADVAASERYKRERQQRERVAQLAKQRHQREELDRLRQSGPKTLNEVMLVRIAEARERGERVDEEDARPIEVDGYLDPDMPLVAED